MDTLETMEVMEVQVRVRRPDGSYTTQWVPFAPSVPLASIRPPGSPEETITLLQSWIEGDAEEQRRDG